MVNCVLIWFFIRADWKVQSSCSNTSTIVVKHAQNLDSKSAIDRQPENSPNVVLILVSILLSLVHSYPRSISNCLQEILFVWVYFPSLMSVYVSLTVENPDLVSNEYSLICLSEHWILQSRVWLTVGVFSRRNFQKSGETHRIKNTCIYHCPLVSDAYVDLCGFVSYIYSTVVNHFLIFKIYIAQRDVV